MENEIDANDEFVKGLHPLGFIENIQVSKVYGFVREYSLLLTNECIVFTETSGLWTVAIRQGLPGGVAAGMGGGAPGGGGAFFGAIIASAMKAEFNRRSKTATKDEKSSSKAEKDNDFIVMLDDIEQILVKKQITNLGLLKIKTKGMKIRCEFPLDKMDEFTRWKGFIEERLGRNAALHSDGSI